MKPVRISLLAAILVTACSSGPTAKELLEKDKQELSAALGMGVSSLEIIHPSIKTLVKRNISGHAGLRQSDLWNVRYSRADLRGRTGDLLPTTVLSLPLRAPLADSVLYLAFDAQGRLAASGTSGTAMKQDRAAIWSGFLSQFSGSSAAQTSDFLTPGKAHLYWKELQDGRISRGGSLELYEQKRLMGENSARIHQVMELTGRGQLPSPAMLRDWASHWQRLDDISPQLGTIIGRDQASQYQDFVAEAQNVLERAAAAAENGRPSDVRRLVGGELGRDSCRTCHSLDSPILGGKLRPSLEHRLDEFGAPPLFRIGRDIWGPDNRSQAAQYLTSTVKAGLLIAGHLQSTRQL